MMRPELNWAALNELSSVAIFGKIMLSYNMPAPNLEDDWEQSEEAGRQTSKAPTEMQPDGTRGDP